MIIKRVSVRRKHLNALFFSDGFGDRFISKDELPCADFSDDGGLLADRGAFDGWGYREGDEVSLIELEQLCMRSRYMRAESKALWLLDTRDYTKRGMRDKLRRDFGEKAADYAVERMVYLGLIDDRRFAERYAEQLTFVRRCSVRDARARLMQKGISRDIIDEVIAELDVSADDQLDELIRSKYAARLENADEKALKKVIDSLARKGFSYSDIRAAIGRFCDAELYD